MQALQYSLFFTIYIQGVNNFLLSEINAHVSMCMYMYMLL